MRKLYKSLALVLAVLLLSVSAYAMEISILANVKAAVNDTTKNRDHVDIVVRYLPDDRTTATGISSQVSEAGTTASQGAVVIWSTSGSAILGRDVTMTFAGDCESVAGVISEAGGIASGAFGRIRIYGYLAETLVADSSDAVNNAADVTLGTQSAGNGTAALLGQCGGGAGVGIALEAGAGTDGDTIQSLINISNEKVD